MKIMLGFIILASMLFISGAISVIEITRLGHSMKGLIDDNYRSIEYTKSMLSTLENQNLALLQYINDGSTTWKDQFIDDHQSFISYLDSARGNLTLDNEYVFIDSIAASYSRFYSQAQVLLTGTDHNLNEYLLTLHSTTSRVSYHVHELMTINQNALYEATAILESSTQRASQPGLIIIIISLVFTMVFTYLVHHFFVSPIIRLTRGINDYVKFRKPFDVPLETRDELYSLKEAIANLVSSCRLGRKQIP